MKRSYSVNDIVDTESGIATDAMAELQATIELSVELNRFYNVDLFQRGYYQVRTVLKTPPKSPARVEVSDNKVNARKDPPSNNDQAFAQSNVGESHKFQIIYRNEEVDLAEMFVYRVHTLVESTKLEKNLENLDFRLDIELWCNDDDEVPDSKMECVSSRSLLLHLAPTKGLHHSLPVLFDYFHLSAVDVIIHGTVIAIHQPYLTMPKSQKGTRPADHSTLEAVYFGTKASSSSSNSSLSNTTSGLRLQQAHLMHKTICNILLSAHESLQENLQLFASKIAGNTLKFERKDCHTRLGEVVMKVQGVMEEDDLIQTAITDITQLCAENVILWAQFLEVALKQRAVHIHLSREHHNLRIRRFAEGFFTMDHTKSSCLSCYDPGIHGHSSLASLVRSSPYFNNLPSLPVECVELDGDATSLPVIFEDIFQDARAYMAASKGPYQYTPDSGYSNSTPVTGSPRQRSASNSSSSLSQTSDRNSSPHMRKRSGKKKFIKNMRPDSFMRPSSYYCSDAESASAKVASSDPAGVTLIGYKKVTLPETSPAVMLGTLSPDSPEHGRGENLPGALRKATSSSSLSAILPSSCMNRGSEESIPESCDNSFRQSSIEQSSVDQSLEEKEGVESPTSLPKTKNNSLYNKHRSENRRLVKSYSQGSQYVTPNPKPTAHRVNSADKADSLNVHQFNKESDKSLQNSVTTPRVSAYLKKGDYNKLADGITRALGDKEETGLSGSKIVSAINHVNDDDISDDDDDTHVANGFHEDDVIETYRKDFSNSASASREKPPSESSPSHSDHLVPLTPESKNNDSALGSEISSQDETSHSPSYVAPPSSTPSQSKDILVDNKDDALNSKDVVVDSKDIVLDAKDILSDAKETSDNTCDGRDGFRQEVTVMELLKEEFNTPRKPEESKRDKREKHPSANSLNHRAASDSDILKNCEDGQLEKPEFYQSQAAGSNQDAIDRRRPMLSSSSSYPELSHATKTDMPRLVSVIGNGTINFVQLRESLKLQMAFPGYLYSECPSLASTIPYFQVPTNLDEFGSGLHLIVCVHGLDGNSADLRLVRTYLEMSLPGFRLEFLMSVRNQQDTFADFDKMTDKLVDEILRYLDTFTFHVSRISFVGHSLGNIIIRSCLSRPKIAHLLPKLYTFLSLSGPHIGTLYNNSGLVNMGMWFLQKWKKSESLLQLALKDHSDPRQTFLYQLSKKPVLQHFKHVLLVGSHQDRYVPYHSSRIEICKSAQKDSSITGAVYREMVHNLLEPIVQSPHTTLIRYDVFHSLPSTANTMIGRAAHIAVLDSEIFIEKFLTVTGLKYFM